MIHDNALLMTGFFVLLPHTNRARLVLVLLQIVAEAV
jgi:hypothetical protein